MLMLILLFPRSLPALDPKMTGAEYFFKLPLFECQNPRDLGECVLFYLLVYLCVVDLLVRWFATF